MQKSIAVISDIHSNLEALLAVLEDIRSQEITEIVCLGDVVGYASDVQECLNKIRELGCPVLLGNHDEGSCLPEPPWDFNDTARQGLIFSAKHLKESDRFWIGTLPRRLTVGEMSFTHASLEIPEHWTYILSAADAEAHFLEQSTHLSFCGHTHKPALWFQPSPGSPITLRRGKGIISLAPSGKVLINVGSVGQPRDGDSRACYVICRDDAMTVDFRRVPYDIQTTRKKISKAGLPFVTAQRLLFGR
jgi:diadenosine tetraphosphatase ApaH/serine/threonine PP2A family protein phosphatase